MANNNSNYNNNNHRGNNNGGNNNNQRRGPKPPRKQPKNYFKREIEARGVNFLYHQDKSYYVIMKDCLNIVRDLCTGNIDTENDLPYFMDNTLLRPFYSLAQSKRYYHCKIYNSIAYDLAVKKQYGFPIDPEEETIMVNHNKYYMLWSIVEKYCAMLYSHMYDTKSVLEAAMKELNPYRHDALNKISDSTFK